MLDIEHSIFEIHRMKTTILHTPSSRLRFGAARVDITPPVGMNHRFWGAATHDRSTAIHRPLLADVLIFEPISGHAESRFVRVQCDLLGLPRDSFASLQARVSEAAAVPVSRISITHSHTHAAGAVDSGRQSEPGGDLIAPYLEAFQSKVASTCRKAVSEIHPVSIEYGTGQCDMGNHRDCWDDENGFHVCGFNPDIRDFTPLRVGRVTSQAGSVSWTFVHYPCHATTLAWDNTEISPDYPGALRETVEQNTGAPCTFLLGTCGELGPRVGYVGDVEIADRNGRQVAFAALATFEGIPPTGHDFAYAGPVISGANLGTWDHLPASESRIHQTELFAAASAAVDLPLRKRPDEEALRRDSAEWEEKIRIAREAGDDKQVQIGRAMQERANRWIARLKDFPAGDTYPLEYTVLMAGDAVWVTVEGEPYSLIQTELQIRFPEKFIMVSPVDRSYQVAYLLPRDKYGTGLYQEEPSSLGPGCLELLIEAIADKIADLSAT
jgi:hypothetical protein